MQDKSAQPGKMVRREGETQQAAETPRVNWDDSNMVSAYANVCNVASTREEVTLLFGTNQTWNSGQAEFSVRLSNRIILSPFAAKRLAMLLANVMGQYEQRFGKLDIQRAVEPAGDVN